MLYQIVSLVLELVVGFVSGACLLRLYMQIQRIPMGLRSGNPLGQLVFAVTDWIVLPLRRWLPAMGPVDTASLVAAYLLALLDFGLLWLLAGAAGGLFAVPILAAFGLLRLSITGITGLVIVYAILSWVPTHSNITQLLDRLVAPLLRPIRRLLPLIGGIDLSPLVLLLLLQVVGIVLGAVQATVLVALASSI